MIFDFAYFQLWLFEPALVSWTRRVLDWAVGLDSEINELVEGSDLYGEGVGYD